MGSRTKAGGWTAESEYFEIRFFKKGTVHLKWKRLDLLEAFNITAAKGKKWLGADTSHKKAAWRTNPDYYCEHHGHEYKDGVCARCERPEVDPFEQIACEFCRTVAEYTGETQCPMHPKGQSVQESAPADAIPSGQISLLMLEAPDEAAA